MDVAGFVKGVSTVFAPNSKFYLDVFLKSLSIAKEAKQIL
jgi:hypothetical protein